MASSGSSLGRKGFFVRECPLSTERLTAQTSCFGREGQDEGVPKERWLEFEGIVVINLGMLRL